jgi:hypothetical protein
MTSIKRVVLFAMCHCIFIPNRGEEDWQGMWLVWEKEMRTGFLYGKLKEEARF